LLRLGHTEEYDEELLSINLPHLCEVELMCFLHKKIKNSAWLRWQKKIKQENINKMMVEGEKWQIIRKEKD